MFYEEKICGKKEFWFSSCERTIFLCIVVACGGSRTKKKTNKHTQLSLTPEQQ